MSAKGSTAAGYKQMIEPSEALEMVLAHTPRGRVESAPIAEALGLTAAQEVRADRDYPPFDRAMMDGFAVRLADEGREVAVAGEVTAGKSWVGQLQDAHCVAITTGSACPAGTQAVVPKELVETHGGKVMLPAELANGKHIAAKGSECRAGTTVLKEAEVITALGIANLAMFGCRNVRVYRRPKVSVIVTGDEIVRAGQEPGECEIRDSNGPMLTALVEQAGAHKGQVYYARDTLDEVIDAIGQASGESDIVLLSGGVSVGKCDVVPEALEAFGARIVFHKVKQRPGKPLLFAIKEGQLFFGLPGNPLSGYVGFHRYVRAAICKMMARPVEPAQGRGRLTETVSNKGPRVRYVLARAVGESDTPQNFRLEPLLGAGSADIHATCRANSCITLPAGEHRLEAGTVIPFEWIGR